MKYIVVTGGVVSGIGKGITISSIGRILKSCGLKVTTIKIDPYLNFDAGTMSPFEHGETFVLDDGGETDLDLGNYERFLDIKLTAKHNITTGKIYSEVMTNERRGDYLGKTVQMIPHVTDAIQAWIKEVSHLPVSSDQQPDVCLIELGGTVGDMESMVYVEALRRLQFEQGRDNVIFIHVSLVPCLGSSDEQKTKPTQESVKTLRGLGLSPDILVCRSQKKLTEATMSKISSMCQIPLSAVMSVYDVSNIYHIPLILVKQYLHKIIKTALRFDGETVFVEPDLASWYQMANIVDCSSSKIQIAIVGKYTDQSDAYLSLTQSLVHSGISLRLSVEIVWIEADNLELSTQMKNESVFERAWSKLKKASGILIPGGFGNRGVEGKLLAAQYARENRVPCLGICLGMQVMVIEYARNVLGFADANSDEFNEKTSYPAIVFMPEIDRSTMGGNMRLGSRGTMIKCRVDGMNEKSIAATVYGLGGEGQVVYERHRHRYEVNPDKLDDLTAAGLIFSGSDEETNKRMEIVELSRDIHPFYFGTQFHPEFKSRPNRPSLPFLAFVAASVKNRSTLI